MGYFWGCTLASCAGERGAHLQGPAYRGSGGEIREVVDYVVPCSKFPRESVRGSDSREKM